jgi:hypothetical protein
MDGQARRCFARANHHRPTRVGAYRGCRVSGRGARTPARREGGPVGNRSRRRVRRHHPHQASVSNVALGTPTQLLGDHPDPYPRQAAQREAAGAVRLPRGPGGQPPAVCGSPGRLRWALRRSGLISGRPAATTIEQECSRKPEPNPCSSSCTSTATPCRSAWRWIRTCDERSRWRLRSPMAMIP